MTIASQTSRISYTGDGSTTAFAVPFYFSANADLSVTVQDLSGNVTIKVLGSDYSLTGATLSTGGTCTFVTAPTTGYIIAVTRVPPITQTASYNNNDPFPAKSHELALDKATTVDQYLKSLMDRAILVAPTDTPPLTTMPPASVRALKYLAFDSLGNPIAGTPGGVSPPISSVMQPVVASSTTAIARSLLGISDPVATRTALKALDTTIITAAFLTEAGREGEFVFRSGNYSTQVAADTQEGIYIKANAISASSGAWVRTGSGVLRIEWFGGVGDGSTDNLAALNAIFALLPTTGGCIEFGAGKFKFSAAVSKTMTNGRQSIQLRGQGVDVTTLYWPAGGGLTITNSHTNNYVNIHDLTFSTGAAGSGIGLYLATTGGALAFGGVSSLARLSFRGDDYDSQTANLFYWGIGLRILNWNNVNIDSITTAGVFTLIGGGAGAGIGLEYGGITPNICAVLNVQNSMFFYHSTYVQLDNYWEGVTFTNNQFDGQVGGVGLYVPSVTHAGPLLQLIGNQFNTGGQQIDIVASVTQIVLHANTITVYGDNNFGALLGTCSDAIVTGNMFNHATGVNTTALSINGQDGTVNGNIFLGVALGVSLGASSSNINVSQNTYNCTTTVSNAGTGNHVGTATQ